MVGDREDVGEVDVRDHITLEVSKGLEAHGSLVFSQECGKGCGDSCSAGLPVCEPKVADKPLGLAVKVGVFEIDFIFGVEFSFDTSVRVIWAFCGVLGVCLSFT